MYNTFESIFMISFFTWCWERVLKISWRKRVTNIVVYLPEDKRKKVNMDDNRGEKKWIGHHKI